MISGDSILVGLVRLVEFLPFPPLPARRKRGQQQTYRRLVRRGFGTRELQEAKALLEELA
jgi:hypothetical protein